jgi:1-pyrroline-5-carboxylate dehydrogenase
MSEKTKITYATLSADDEALQLALDAAIAQTRDEWLGVEVPAFINGERVIADEKIESYSPIDTGLHVCSAQKGTADDAKAAIAAAKAAFPGWRETPWQERVAVIRKVADRMEEETMALSAMLIFEVGKSRLEALGEVTEAIDLLRYYAKSMEENDGFIKELGKLNPDDPNEKNYSVLRPYGVWVVISPFNFPLALSAAPIAAALVTGNTVVFKGSSDTLCNGWRTAELFAEAGLPRGVLNYVSGPGSTVGEELLENPDVDGWTFTGSYEIGQRVLRAAIDGPFPRPAIIEAGGKNPAIVSKTADLDKAVTGVVRSAFGLSGQKCSACSRVYVQEDVYEAFRERLVGVTRALSVGDPTQPASFMGTVINRRAYENYQRYVAMARDAGTVLAGGGVRREKDLSKGYFVEPTVVEGLSEGHEMVKKELFVPILHIVPVRSLEEAMEKANDTHYGLTAGFFGEDQKEIEWFYANIQAGTTYVNREAGATSGAWPGVQAFGGWKGSGSSGKAIGGLYTLALYMREQSRTTLG